MNKKNDFEVSVVVLTYNSKIEDIIHTLNSILLQKDIHIQIIISDDASEIDYSEDIKSYLENCDFKDYIIRKNEVNEGTCYNYYHAVLLAEGEYIKPISPKDYLYTENTLNDWYKFMKENEVDVSFGNAVYYTEVDSNILRPISHSNQPVLKGFYELDNCKRKKLLITNIILWDMVLGASYFCKRELILLYLQEIIGKIIYCEDACYRLMLLDNKMFALYNRNVVYYSYGTGISTFKQGKANERMSKDDVAFDKILQERKCKDAFQKRIHNYVIKKGNCSIKNRLISFIYFPSALFYKIKIIFLRITGRANTDCSVDSVFLKLIGINVFEEA